MSRLFGAPTEIANNRRQEIRPINIVFPYIITCPFNELSGKERTHKANPDQHLISAALGALKEIEERVCFVRSTRPFGPVLVA